MVIFPEIDQLMAVLDHGSDSCFLAAVAEMDVIAVDGKKNIHKATLRLPTITVLPLR